ncbi:MAG: hypothetical protein PF484_10620 [Bacteroidales bacterium]|jgi:hypothetical protein|nr:hypothetical protein [Bacteroidales bacterium]
MSKANTENLIKVDDAVLTKEALSIISGLQDEDNSYLNDFRSWLADTAFGILKLTRDESTEVKQEYVQMLSHLELMREELNLLQAPE